MRFTFTGLTPYTRYTVVVRAKAAGEVGPAAEDEVTTPPEGIEDSSECDLSFLLHCIFLIFENLLMLFCTEAPCSLPRKLNRAHYHNIM